MKTLLAAAAFALLITPAQAGTWGCFKAAIMLQPVVGEECGDRNAREARGFERRSIDRPTRPEKPHKPEKPGKPNKPEKPEKERHDHGKGDHSAGKGKGHEKGRHKD